MESMPQTYLPKKLSKLLKRTTHLSHFFCILHIWVRSILIIEQGFNISVLTKYSHFTAVHSANTYSPLQAPKEIVDAFKYIKDKNRRKFAGMLYKLDESVGKVVSALAEKDMLKDSVIM